MVPRPPHSQFVCSILVPLGFQPRPAVGVGVVGWGGVGFVFSSVDSG